MVPLFSFSVPLNSDSYFQKINTGFHQIYFPEMLTGSIHFLIVSPPAFSLLIHGKYLSAFLSFYCHVLYSALS